MKNIYLLFTMLLISTFTFGQYATKLDAKLERKTMHSATQSDFVQKSVLVDYFSEGFEAGDLATTGWTTSDEDGDAFDWAVVTDVTPHSGTANATSASWDATGGALTPENWLISPAIDLSAAAGTITLEWWAGAQDQAWPSEKYKVVISTTDASVASFTDQLFEEVVVAGGEDGYFERSVNLSTYAGGTVYIAWVHYDCTDNFRLNLDDVLVYENLAVDAAILDITAPSNDGGCTLTAAEDITVTIKNLGGAAITGFDVSYAIDGGTPVTETVSATINPTEELNYTFTAQADLSTLAVYEITAEVALTGDEVPANDIYSMDITSGDAEITIHALTDNMGGQSWTVTNNLTSEIVAERTTGWQWNIEVTETICVIDANCYTVVVSDSDGDGMVDGSAYLEILYDGIQVAGSTTPDSWSTAELVAENLGSGCTAADAGVQEIAPIMSSCDLGMADITVTIKNFGTDDITDVPVSYTIDGGTPVTETATGTMLAGETMEYTFTVQGDFSTDGTYEIEAYTELVGDENATNDTATYEVVNVAPAAAPYTVDFDAPEQFLGLYIEDVNADGNTWGIYAGVGVGGTACAGYSYSATEAADDYIYTSCLDLSAGTDYKLSFIYAAYDAGYAENLKVFIGDAQVSTAMTTELIDLPALTNETFEAGVVDVFTVPADGTFYIGFQAYSDADMNALFVDDIMVEFSTEVSDVTVSNISIFPNPANNAITVVNAENENIVVINMLGEVVANINNASSNQRIDISNLANGTYFVKVNSEVIKVSVVK